MPKDAILPHLIMKLAPSSRIICLYSYIYNSKSGELDS